MGSATPGIRRTESVIARRARCRAAVAMLAVALVAVPLRTPAQDGDLLALSFDEAAARLERVSDALAASEANLGSKRDLADATADLRLPDVSLDVREIKYQKSLDVSLGALAPTLGQLGIPATISLNQRDWRFRPSVTATLPLYTGGQIPAAQHAAAAAVRQAQAERDNEAQSQTLQLVQVYFGQQLAARALEVRREVRDGLQRHLDDAQKLEAGGMATKAQRLQATVARDQADRDWQKAVNELDTLAETLARILRSSQKVETRTPLFVIAQPLADAETFRRAAADNHPAIARLAAIIDQATQGVRVQQAKLKPQVFLFGQRDLYREDALFTDADWVFGIGLKYTFLSNTDRPRQVSAARGQLEQAQAGLREAQNQVAIGVTRAWNQLETARRQFLLLDSTIAQTQENLRLQELSFREGQSTSLDVIDARLRLGGAAIERAQAAYQYDVALAQLLEVSGQMQRYSDYVKQADKVIAP